ncbi:MAG TPA: hypothetical protein VGK89_03335 [Candidatus Eisenbacteria bacterium]|jgi:hypothetical protein
MKRWTRGATVAAALVALSGCVAGFRLTTIDNGLADSSRPQASYYCYDCHRDRYFDPYYDWCAYYGFRYDWAGHPEAVALYRERYPRIKEAHPDYGRYRYRAGYRGTRRYREPRSYEAWRSGEGTRTGERAKDREKRPDPDRRDPERR